MPLKTFADIKSGRDLTDEEQGKFYDTMKSTVWVLKTRKGPNVGVACGLCIDNTGHILTTSCAVGESDVTVLGREIHSSSFQELKVVKRGKSMLILEPSEKKKGYDYAHISQDSMQITECQEVYCIVHEVSGLYSFAVGEVSHRKRMIDGISHFQVANVHTIGHSDIVFSSTGHALGIVLRKVSHKVGEVPDVGHNLVLHFSEINKFVKFLQSRASKSKKR